MKYIFLILFVAVVMQTGCNSENKNSQTILVDSSNTDSVAHVKKVKKIFYNMPSPVEMSKFLMKSGANYNPNLLNPISNYSKYTTNSSIALNLGAYGADLSYSRIMEQIQETINYLTVIKKLSAKLGIPQDEKMFAIKDFEDNIDNRDSLLQIIIKSYSVTDQYLKENERGSTSVFVLIGGWIETLYLAVNLVDFKKPNNELIERIGEQKFSLTTLISLLDIYKDENQIAEYCGYLEEMKVFFDKIESSNSGIVAETDSVAMITTLDSKTDLKFNLNNIKEIKRIVIKVRNNMIK